MDTADQHADRLDETTSRVDVSAYSEETGAWPSGHGIWVFTPKFDDGKPVILVGGYELVRHQLALAGGDYTLAAWKKDATAVTTGAAAVTDAVQAASAAYDASDYAARVAVSGVPSGVDIDADRTVKATVATREAAWTAYNAVKAACGIA